MILPLRIRTEYSFRLAYGQLDQVIAATGTAPAIAITDRHGTWGHVQWSKKCKAVGKKPVFGVELAVANLAKSAVVDAREKLPVEYFTFIAKSNRGLQELYSLVTLATDGFYYFPRLDYSALADISREIYVLAPSSAPFGFLRETGYIPPTLSPLAPPFKSLKSSDETGNYAKKRVAVADNYYPTPEDRAAYEITVGSRGAEHFTWPMHLITEDEWRLVHGDNQAIKNANAILQLCDADLPLGEMVKFDSKKTLRQLCIIGAKRLGIMVQDSPYKERLARELKLIKEKKFEDYFFVIADMLDFAKDHMLVGPARGSSCGSLVCYFLGITEIDPIPFNLLFERFIDINRADLPDIDIDFPDEKRDMVFEYLAQKYGADKVARLGTVSRFKAKSAIGGASKELGIPQWEVTDLKNSIIERSTGDARAAFCIMDTFDESDIGKMFLKKYPELRIAEKMENHARHSGQHAAGVLVTPDPITTYCSKDNRTGAAQIDKKDAEELNLLKIDALGLRTLTVLDECLTDIGWSREKMLRYPYDDKDAYQVLNDKRFAGIFQFEGQALQGLTKQMKIESFEDISVLTALARPGPLVSGGTNEFIARRTGRHPAQALHPRVDSITAVTLGVVVYQEQVMQIAREIGNLSWGDVSELRKAMSHSLGKEYFDQFYKRFAQGARKNGLSEIEAMLLWDNINTMGSWAFNRSHAVAYGTVSYWCCVLKAHYPLQFAAATLRHSKSEDQTTRLLRELVSEGYEYVAIDPDHSEENWSVKDGKLIGGLTNAKGVGPKKAARILERRNAGEIITRAERKLLEEAENPYAELSPCAKYWGHIKDSPADFNIQNRMLNANEIDENTKGDFVFIGRLIAKTPRDLNETIFLQKRKGQVLKGQTKYLNMILEDDTDSIMCSINTRGYNQWGHNIVENGKVGDWYMFRGHVRNGFRKIHVAKVRKLNLKDSPAYDHPGI